MNKMLIVYASRFGSTTAVAEAIGKALGEMGIAADVRRASEAANISSYRAVIIGSPIYGDKWLDEAAQFVEREQFSLAKRPVALFTVGLSQRQQDNEARRTVTVALKPIRELVKPLDVGLFAGSTQHLPWWMRLLSRLSRMPIGDFRDWDAIRSWALTLPAKFAEQR